MVHMDGGVGSARLEIAYDTLLGDPTGRVLSIRTLKRRRHAGLEVASVVGTSDVNMSDDNNKRRPIGWRSQAAVLMHELGVPRPEECVRVTVPTMYVPCYFGSFVGLVGSQAGRWYLAGNPASARQLFRVPSLEAAEMLFLSIVAMTGGAVVARAAKSAFPAVVWFFLTLKWGFFGTPCAGLACGDLGSVVSDRTVQSHIDEWLGLLWTHSQFTVCLLSPFQTRGRLLRQDARALGDAHLCDGTGECIMSPRDWCFSKWAYGHKNRHQVVVMALHWAGTGYTEALSDATWSRIREVAAMMSAGFMWLLPNGSTLVTDKGPSNFGGMTHGRINHVVAQCNTTENPLTGVKQLSRTAALEQGVIASGRSVEENSFSYKPVIGRLRKLLSHADLTRIDAIFNVRPSVH